MDDENKVSTKMAMIDQPSAALGQQAAPPVQQMAAPRFNYRVVAGLERHQVENIEILRKKLGSSDTGVLRTALDLLSFCNGLPVASDPTIFLNNWIVRRTNLIQNGE